MGSSLLPPQLPSSPLSAPDQPVDVVHDLLLGAYRALPSSHDELLAPDGGYRPHWQRFIKSLQRLRPQELQRRWDEGQSLVYENAMTYGAFGDPMTQARPWELDMLPLVLAKEEWERLAAGLQQRARLLDLVLQDLFGSQRLLQDGVLPPDILFRHPGYEIAYHSAEPARHRWIHYYAADLARGSDGRWWVLGDRTEAPSGMGFTLENRVVMSRMLPNIFRECYVQRLAPFFVALQNLMRDLAPRNRDNPRIVVLSQGPKSRNFFEDAYLARYLGYGLVEGSDLSVRNGTVTLKTLDGLLPVDVLLRRPNSEACDPLELDGAAVQGIPGLMQAIRSRNCAVANHLGSGLVESPVLLSFIGTLCQRLLGEDLLLPTVATWWCGQPDSLSHVLAHLDDLVVKRAFRLRGQGHQHTQQLNRMPRQQLIDLIRSDPPAFVAQEKVRRSTIPQWNGGNLRPVFMALRSYLVATEDGYQVMPGGLTRTSTAADSLEASLQAGEGSKDTWILDDAQVEPITLLPPSNEPVPILRGRSDLPSRVADNLFWLGRNLERTEAAARTLRTVVLRLTSESGSGGFSEIPSLLRLLVEQGQIEPGFVVEGIRQQLPAIEQALPRLVYDTNQSGSLRALLNQIFRIASNVRDRISVDSWRIILRIDEEAQPPDERELDLTYLLNLTNRLILHLAAFSGMMMESMTRTHIFRFVDLGRRLERAMQILQIVETLFLMSHPTPSKLMEAALEIADSSMTYRTRYLANLQIAAVLDLLLTDETNPRSLAFQLALLHQHVDGLPHEPDQPTYSTQQRIAMTMLHNIRMVDMNAMSEPSGKSPSKKLQNLIQEMSGMLPQLSNAISLRYLSHSKPSHMLGDLLPGS